MKVIQDCSTNYDGDPIRFLNFEEFENGDDSVTLSYGCICEKATPSSKLLFLDLEEPIPRPENIRNRGLKADIVLNLCPWSSEWHNKHFGHIKCVPVFFPFNPKFAPPTSVKDIDILYAGQMHGVTELESMVGAITPYNYAHVCFAANQYSTHVNVSYQEKMALYGRSKISLVHNILWLNDHWANVIKQYYPDWESNYAYKDIDQTDPRIKTYPQLKSRAFEAAFSKSLILCRKDQFGVLEQYFTEGKEFIYYSGENDMLNKIQYFLNHDYTREKIIEAAYQRAVSNYTTKHFYDKFIKPHHAEHPIAYQPSFG